MTVEIIGLVFEMILGTLGHFLYDITSHNKIIGFFFSKSENVWEHLKLGITPIILWTIIELFINNFPNLFFAKFVSILAFSISIIILYNTIKFLFKKNILFLDILIFYISLGISSIISINLLKSNNNFIINLFSFIGICFTLYLYKVFNKNTPNWFIFKRTQH